MQILDFVSAISQKMLYFLKLLWYFFNPYKSWLFPGMEITN